MTGGLHKVDERRTGDGQEADRKSTECRQDIGRKWTGGRQKADRRMKVIRQVMQGDGQETRRRWQEVDRELLDSR